MKRERRDRWHYNVGEALLAQSQVGDAIEHYRASLALVETLVEKDAANANWQQLAAMSHERIGDCLAKQRKDASAEYALGLAIAQRLAETDPSNVELRKLVEQLTAKSH